MKRRENYNHRENLDRNLNQNNERHESNDKRDNFMSRENSDRQFGRENFDRHDSFERREASENLDRKKRFVELDGEEISKPIKPYRYSRPSLDLITTQSDDLSMFNEEINSTWDGLEGMGYIGEDLGFWTE